MELSIASAAAAIALSCFKVSTLMYHWIEEVREVDGTLKAFSAEINALSAVLDAVQSCSQDALATEMSQRQGTGAFWVLVERTLEDCGKVMAELDRVLTDIRSRRRFGQLITNSTLNANTGKMAMLRQQVQSYTTILQMALQMINV